MLLYFYGCNLKGGALNNFINFKIDGISVRAQKDETILSVARKNGIYIPTMCHLSKTSPAGSCRMCVVEAKGIDGFILSCNTPAVEDIEVTTNSQNLQEERANIVKLYDVNHPLQCGVCDKSGECELQNKTLEFDVSQQNFSARDQKRQKQDWGLINYDPSLCILCEKCVRVCNEVIGDDAIEVKFGGYTSSIVPKNSDILDCTFCGECIAVCPVGALVNSDFKYSSNAWELKKTPAICVHCSAGCSLEYEVKHTAINGEDTIYRVKNNFEFTSLCGAGRFGFDFDNKGKKDKEVFSRAIEKIKNANAIRFSSMITNEEAYMLQLLKEKLNVKLFNEDARVFQEFMNSYSTISGKKHHSGSLEAIKQADGIIVLGSKISSDNPAIRYAMTTASKHNGAKIIYAHPVEDFLLQSIVTQFMKYEVGTEEGVVALLGDALLRDADLSQDERDFFDDLDEGYLGAECNIGEEEFDEMLEHFATTKKRVLVVGSDVLAHDRALNIAKLVAMIEKYTDFSLVVVPSQVNTLGASLICNLDKDEDITEVVGYNANGDFMLSSFRESDLSIPALNQQEGTFVSMDNRVLPTNVALKFEGYNLKDICYEFDIKRDFSIEFTKELGQVSGFKDVDFDELKNYLSDLGEDERGYLLDEVECQVNGKLEEIEDLPEFNGTVIYNCNPVLQFNEQTNQAKLLESDTSLRGSAQFAAAAKISDGDSVEIHFDSRVVKRDFVLDKNLKGTIALNPVFDDVLYDPSKYRFKKSKIVRIINE
jgi:NADH-quinone oxidoreductase subunit G